MVKLQIISPLQARLNVVFPLCDLLYRYRHITDENRPLIYCSTKPFRKLPISISATQHKLPILVNMLSIVGRP